MSYIKLSLNSYKVYFLPVLGYLPFLHTVLILPTTAMYLYSVLYGCVSTLSFSHSVTSLSLSVGEAGGGRRNNRKHTDKFRYDYKMKCGKI